MEISTGEKEKKNTESKPDVQQTENSVFLNYKTSFLKG